MFRARASLLPAWLAFAASLALRPRPRRTSTPPMADGSPSAALPRATRSAGARVERVERGARGRPRDARARSGLAAPDPRRPARRGRRVRGPTSRRSGTPSSTDDPDRAMPFFFPLGAYRQVKDVTDPAADWKHRLVAAYRRDIHALHARLGADAGDADASRARRPRGARALGRAGRGVEQDRLLPRLRLEAPLRRRRRGARVRREVAHLVARRVVRRASERHRLTASHARPRGARERE